MHKGQLIYKNAENSEGSICAVCKILDIKPAYIVALKYETREIFCFGRPYKIKLFKEKEIKEVIKMRLDSFYEDWETFGALKKNDIIKTCMSDEYRIMRFVDSDYIINSYMEVKNVDLINREINGKIIATLSLKKQIKFLGKSIFNSLSLNKTYNETISFDKFDTKNVSELINAVWNKFEVEIDEVIKKQKKKRAKKAKWGLSIAKAFAGGELSIKGTGKEGALSLKPN